ncbi:Rad3-related DNA helicase [Secundilactobacillus oryzae JCM 18671]|uniref:3'-5' exonuclease DinG n=1 Tax=Secundilactobacillus oryzae JCM 18671 TaxID=1291743 RepID=A0A081BIL4_9LACO|nr:helicase C-terminal domain-containing protein [Secundilactobacillus oryzae]GAK47882.1 Rad3-related DNA helicase [Secundilactobacillus oryzae JCM 18671]
METETTYAVVDLETTGTSLTEGGRIIQFGCAFVKNNQIIDQFSTDVNPEMPISEAITRLTGITNKRVAKAPIFDDVAEVIYGMLANTTFVAHNVNFDLPFLNHELERVGFPALTGPAIDTVQLSQILLPTATSYRLQDLSQLFSISHENPHSADSDAEATANLLIFLLDRLRTLPLTTLKQLNQIQAVLTRETGTLFAEAIQYVNHHLEPLPDYLLIKNGLALRKPMELAQTTPLTPNLTYPKTQKQKKQRYQNQLEWRPEQAKMMNLIYHNFDQADDQKQLLIEAPTGVGKSMGYSLPMAYLAKQHHQVVISTATTLLQDQLVNQTMPVLNQILPFKTAAILLKGSQHYLDLDRFATSLKVVDHSPQSQLVKMKILVWLTQTLSGDLDELHLSTDQVPYLETITHMGFNFQKRRSTFGDDDFLVRRNQRLDQADFVITNHAYLVKHGADLGQKLNQPYLVIDEAQNLAENALNEERQTVEFNAFQKEMRRLQNIISNQHGKDLLDLFNEDGLAMSALERLMGMLDKNQVELQVFVNKLYKEFLGRRRAADQDGYLEVEVKTAQLRSFFADNVAQLNSYQRFNRLLNELAKKLMHQYRLNEKRWLVTDKLLVAKFEKVVLQITAQLDQLIVFEGQIADEQTNRVFWLRVNHVGDTSSLQLISNLLTTHNYLSSKIYSHFQPVVLTGASLLSSRNSPFIYDQLDVDRTETKTRKIKSDFDFSLQSQLYIATDSPDPVSTIQPQYEAYLVNALSKLLVASNKQTLVLFNSLETIQHVYGGLRANPQLAKRVILAQGVTGSREKIIKRFKSTGENAIILGAASFWEGLDFPSSQLELLVVTRLPFDSPGMPMVKAVSDMLKEQGKSPFYSYALPKATLKLKQGIGRLIRSRQDTGVTVILDSRIQQRQYGHTMLSAMPDGLPIFKKKLDQITEEMKLFFEQHNHPTNEE